MKNKFILFPLTFLLIISTPCFSYATELTQPKQPDVHNEQAVNKYNQKIGQYNKQIDKIYQEEIEQYNKTVEYNNQEKQRVDQTNAEQEKIVNQHNTEEDAKVEQNQKDLQQYKKDLQQYDSYLNSPEYAVDKKNANAVLARYDSIAEYNMLPFKAGDDEKFKEIYTNHAVDRKTVKQENLNLKEQQAASTIKVKDAEEKTGKTYTVTVTHIFTDPYFQPIKTISFSQEEVDVNDTVTIISLANNVGSKLVLVDDDKYGVFYTYIADKYLTCYWYQSFGYAEYTRLKVSNDFSEYQLNGNAYNFTLKNGSYYSSDAPYFEVLYYYTYWNTVNELLEAPKEVTKYIPNYWTVKYETPNYLTAVIPVKGKYLSPINYVPLFNENKDIVTPLSRDNDFTLVPSKVKSNTTTKTHFIENSKVPLHYSAHQKTTFWALLNLLITIFSIILSILFIILYFYKRKSKEENDNQTRIKEKSFIKRLFSTLCSIVAVVIFIFTEDMSLPMQWTDKYTILMAIILILQVIGLTIIKKKEDQQDNNN